MEFFSEWSEEFLSAFPGMKIFFTFSPAEVRRKDNAGHDYGSVPTKTKGKKKELDF